jgi:hypothetical protein
MARREVLKRAIQVVAMVVGAVVADCADDSDEETSNSESELLVYEAASMQGERRTDRAEKETRVF